MLHTDRKINTINDIAIDSEKKFNDLIDRLSKQYMANIDWWVSEIASRNTNVCPLYKNIVHYQLNASYPKYRPLFLCLKNFFVYGYSCALLTYRWLVAKIQSNRKQAINKPITLVDMFIFNHSFDDNHNYNDRYYGRMHNYLSSAEKKSFYYNPTFQDSIKDVWKTFKHLRQSRQQFLLKEDYLKLRDYLWAFLYPMRAFKFFPKKTLFEGKDITPIIRHAFWSTLFSNGSIEGLLKYRFAKRLKEKNIPIRLIVDWFENQAIDKGSNLGFRKYYPNEPIIGYVCGLASRYYLGLTPTAGEQKAKVTPHQAAVCGCKILETQKKLSPATNFCLAPAFRMQYLYDERKFYPNEDKFTILVPLPLYHENCTDILKPLSQFTLQSINKRPVEFLIKSHPGMINFSKFFKHFELDKKPNFHQITGDWIELLEKSHLVISNGSSVCLESLSKGIPCIIAEDKNKISQNSIPLEIDNRMWRICHSASDLNKIMPELLSIDQKTKDQIAKKIREDYIETVSEEKTRAFLQL